MDFVTTGPGQYRVQHDSWMDGGGTWFGQEYIDIVQQRYSGQTFERCYEWCAGPAFIGFSLLDHGLCSSLCVSDIYPDAIARVQETAKMHQLTNVSAYSTGTVGGLPDHEMFNLVVANPPHFLACPGNDHYQRIAVDQGWLAHQEFFKNIGQHLASNGVILLQENQAGSLNREKDFVAYIESAGLEITEVFDSPKHYTPDHYTQIYYIEIRQK